MKKKMRIRTTPSFKCRRLADYTRNALPEISEKSRQRMIAHWRAAGRDRMEKEIFNSCIVLKNLALVHRDMPMSADFILEQLMESSRALRSVYADILSAYRNGRGEDSFRILFERVPLKAAKNFALLLANHGLVTFAPDLEHAFSFAEAVEKVAQQIVISWLLGTPVPIDEAEIQFFKAYSEKARQSVIAAATGA